MYGESNYLAELEKVKTLDELDALEQKRHAAQYRAKYGDLGSVLPLLAYGMDQVRQAARDGNDSELEFHIEFF